ncbi:MAG: hypothetical protein IH600_10260 [Bacteroidetes bacterium]|nr:hypothetical protein [Bacteroidota bacterium]
MNWNEHDWENTLPDVRDGLTRLQRIILFELNKARKEPWLQGRTVPTPLLYGRVVEHLDVSEEDFMTALRQLLGRHMP